VHFCFRHAARAAPISSSGCRCSYLASHVMGLRNLVLECALLAGLWHVRAFMDCCSLCSCEDGCTDCDPYENCVAGGCEPGGQGEPLHSCCPPKNETVASTKSLNAKLNAKLLQKTTKPLMDCCSLCSCEDGCTDCDPYENCVAGGCEPGGQGEPLHSCCPPKQESSVVV